MDRSWKPLNRGRPLKILNPPRDDNDFDLLINKRVLKERQFLYNGDLVSVPDNFNISFAEKEHTNTLDNVNLITNIDSVKDRRPIYIDPNNLYECIEMLHIDNTQAINQPGHLEQYDQATQFFYITGTLTQDEWQYLLHKINEYCPKHDRVFDFVLAPGVEIENVKINDEAPLPDNRIPPAWIISNDIDYSAEKVKAEFKAQNEEAVIIDITPQTSFSDLIAALGVKPRNDESGKVDFSYEEQALLRMLNNETLPDGSIKKAKHIILNGDLPPLLQQQLLPLLSNTPQLLGNGELKTQFDARIIAIQTPAAANQLTHVKYAEHQFTPKDYAAHFSASDQQQLEKINDFIRLAEKLPHRGAGRPTHVALSFARIKNMIDRLNNKDTLHKNNPIKGVFHYDYPKDSEDYAYLNVMAKLCFEGEIKANFAKLQKIMRNEKITNIEQCASHQWQLLNCLSAQELKHIFNPDIKSALDKSSKFPSLTPQAQQSLWNLVRPKLAIQNEQTNKPSHVKKRKTQLLSLVNNKDIKVIHVKGKAGVGKTRSVNKLRKVADVYDINKEGILKWLTHKDPNKPCILLIDEANMKKPGTWDFLKGLSRDGRTIYYNGQLYQLGDQHKIIMTGNPESNPGRHFHTFMQHHAESLHFAMSERDYLVDKLLLKTLGKDYTHDFAEGLVKAFELACQFNPTYPYSHRDIENAAQRFISLYQKDQNEPMALIWHVSVSEYANTILDPDKRKKFAESQALQLGLPDSVVSNDDFYDKYYNLPSKNENNLIKLTDNCLVPEEKRELLQKLQQNLMIRERVIKGEKIEFYKQGILLEGDSGIGKSTLLIEFLESQGFREGEKATESTKRYYVVSAGNEKEVVNVLRKAKKEGALVVLDELNLDAALEDEMIELMKDVTNGFGVWSSQNPGYFENRKAVSDASRNRMDVNYMSPYSKTAHIDLAREYKAEQPEVFVDAYLDLKQEHSKTVNMRTFFTMAKKETLNANVVVTYVR